MAKATAGFTLIEILIALVITGITATLAVASYRGTLMRAARSEAIQALLTVAAEQEKFHLSHGTYSSRLDAAPGDEPPGLPVASQTPHRRYRLAIESADASGYLAVAQPKPRHVQDDPQCMRMSIDESGRRRAEDAERRDSTASCW